ncbi:MAG: AraC family transcriptional regulator [Bacteroidota bacterium]|nr:AraC family transcriptional regulator [Bacteroidota bacterium]
MSKFHLLRLFRRYYGQTPKQYLIEKRLEHAKHLLATGHSASDTCYQIGFESPSAFSTLFTSRFGISPASFQKRAIFTK